MILGLAKKALASPVVFDTYQSIVGARACHQRFIHEMVNPVVGERVLDVGCGVGASIRYIPETVEYVGIDISEAYIAKAKADYGHRGSFICADATTVDPAAIGSFDRAFCFGVLHHLPDEVAINTMKLVQRLIKPGGIFVSIDPCRLEGQHPIARLLINNDRGEHIRDPAGFERLLAGMGNLRTAIYQDLLRIPYTQFVMWLQFEPQQGRPLN